jgi:AcrR family transcriptional regulator
MAYRRTPAVEARLGRTRQAILRAARRAVAEHGLTGVGVTSVAADAGVSVGTVYRYFDHKTALLREVVDDVCSREIEVVAKLAATPTDPTERFVAAVDGFARRAVASGEVAYAVIAEPAPAEVETTRVRHRRDLAAVFAAIIADGVATGDFPSQDPDLAATAIVGAVSEVIVGPLAPAVRRGTEVEAVLAQTVALACRAVIGHSGPPPADPPQGGTP